MRSGKVVSLVVILVWFYLLLAAIVNPVFTSSSVPNNPLMPFLPADIVALLWPPILVSAPVVLVAGQRLVKASEGSQREISPEEFIRIQARAVEMSASDRQSVRHSATPDATVAARAELPSATAELVETTADRGTVQEIAQPSITFRKESEFTPPPTASRETVAKESVTPDESAAPEQPKQDLEIAAHLGPVDKFKGIQELEAEKGAVLSLMERLEEMNLTEAIKRKLYEKLKRKYSEQLEKIDRRMIDLSGGKIDLVENHLE